MTFVLSGNPPVTSWRFFRSVQLVATPTSERRKLNSYDSHPTSRKSGALAASLSLWSGALRAGVRERRDAGRDRMETCLPFGAGRMQSDARRFSGGSRQALSP